MSKTFLEAMKNRRSYYGLAAESPISDIAIQSILETAITHAPSAFNSQTSRVVLLNNDEHKALWNIVLETLRGIVPSAAFGKTEEKILTFFAAYGTILFFEEQETVRSMQEQFPTYKDNFPVWSEQSTGILQFIIWTALEDAGLGASIQHYNPLIDEQVKAYWNLPESWKLTAQMPFGKITASAGEKTFLPMEERMKIFG